MRRIGTGPALAAAAVVAALGVVAAGGLSSTQALDTLGRTWPVPAFLLLIAVAADLLAELGLFRSVGSLLTRLARRRVPVLVLLLTAVCVAVTTTMSLDATAVLATPVAIAVAAEAGVPALPLALLCLWLANTASLLLPVANLTSLLASRTGGWTAAEFVSATWRPQLVLIGVTLIVVAVVHRRALRAPAGRRAASDSTPTPVLASGSGATSSPSAAAWASAAYLGAFTVAIVAGAEPWAAAGCLVVMLLAVRWALAGPGRRRWRESMRGVGGAVASAPWAMAAGVGALFVLMAAVTAHWGAGLADAVGPTDDAAGRWRLAAAGAGAANLVDNLPAYLALEPVAGDRRALTALLVGVNAGPLVTPWASLAGLLWWRACRRAGLRVPGARVAAEGALIAAAGVGLAVLLV